MTNVKLVLLYISTLSLLSLAIGQTQAKSNTSTASHCVGHDNRGQAFVYVSCLFGGQIQQLCANWGSLFANGSLMGQLPVGLNCSGIMKTAIANCNGNMTCYSAPSSLPNSSINSTALGNMTNSSNVTTTSSATGNMSVLNVATTANSTTKADNNAGSSILLSGSLANLASPQIHSGPKILYIHLFYDDVGWLHLKGAINSNANYTDFEAKVVLYNGAHQVLDVDDGFWKVITVNNIKAFEALIASPDKLNGAATYQIDGELT